MIVSSPNRPILSAMELRAIHLGFAELISETQRFINQHWIKVGALNLIAAFGRLTQEGGFGIISPWLFALIDVLVIVARFGLIVLVLGQGSWQAGVKQIVLFPKRMTTEGGLLWKQLKLNVFWNKIAFSVNFIVVMIIGTVTNLSIQLFTHLFFFNWLKSHQFIDPKTTAWGVIQFLGNLSITPFTVVFMVLVGMFLVRKPEQR